MHIRRGVGGRHAPDRRQGVLGARGVRREEGAVRHGPEGQVPPAQHGAPGDRPGVHRRRGDIPEVSGQRQGPGRVPGHEVVPGGRPRPGRDVRREARDALAQRGALRGEPSEGGPPRHRGMDRGGPEGLDHASAGLCRWIPGIVPRHRREGSDRGQRQGPFRPGPGPGCGGVQVREGRLQVRGVRPPGEKEEAGRRGVRDGVRRPRVHRAPSEPFHRIRRDLEAQGAFRTQRGERVLRRDGTIRPSEPKVCYPFIQVQINRE